MRINTNTQVSPVVRLPFNYMVTTTVTATDTSTATPVGPDCGTGFPKH